MNEENIEEIKNEKVDIEINEAEDNLSDNNGKVKVEIRLGNLVSLGALACSLVVLVAVIISFIN